MIKIFLVCVAASISSFAQIELNGRAIDESGLLLVGYPVCRAGPEKTIVFNHTYNFLI